MPIDSSIYQNLKPVEAPDLMGTAAKAMTLSQLGMQNKKLQREDSENDAVKAAFQKNMSPDGTLNEKGFLSDVGGINPTLGLQYQTKLSELAKNKSDAAASNAKSIQDVAAITLPELIQFNKLPQEAKKEMHPQLMESFAARGIPMHNVPGEFRQDWLDQTIGTLMQYKPGLDMQKTQAEIGETLAKTRKTNADIGKVQNEKVPNQSQFAAATYGTRAAQAEDVFGELAQKGFDPTSLKNTAIKSLPGFLEGVKGEDVKRQSQAERNFVNAILRRESGAAISKDEFANAESQYFPRNGDTPEVLRQKELNRKTAAAALNAEGAPALGRVAQSMSGMTIGSSIPKNGSDGLIPSANAADTSEKKPAPLTPQDAEAIHWAQRNASDPRAQKILQLHGMK